MREKRLLKNLSANWVPRSMPTCSGTPNLEIYLDMKAMATEIAIDQSEDLLYTNELLYQCMLRVGNGNWWTTEGRVAEEAGPTMSIWTVWERSFGVQIGATGDCVRQLIFSCWEPMQCFTTFFLSVLLSSASQRFFKLYQLLQTNILQKVLVHRLIE